MAAWFFMVVALHQFCTRMQWDHHASKDNIAFPMLSAAAAAICYGSMISSTGLIRYKQQMALVHCIGARVIHLPFRRYRAKQHRSFAIQRSANCNYHDSLELALHTALPEASRSLAFLEARFARGCFLRNRVSTTCTFASFHPALWVAVYYLSASQVGCTPLYRLPTQSTVCRRHPFRHLKFDKVFRLESLEFQLQLVTLREIEFLLVSLNCPRRDKRDTICLAFKAVEAST